MVVVCGAGKWQLQLISHLQRVRETVIIISPNSIEIIRESDIYIECNLIDTERALNLLKPFEFQIETAISDQSDLGISLASQINSFFNLKGLTFDKADIFLSKFKLDQVISEIAPEYSKGTIILESLESLFLKLESHEKIVLKPLDSQSSKGVILLHNKMYIHALKQAYLMARNYSPTHRVICEPFFEGTEYTFEGIILSSKFELIGISKKSHSSFGIADALFYKKEWKEIYGEVISDLMQRLTDDCMIDNVVIHGEFLASNSLDIKIVEIACRGGGTKVGSTICELLVGYSPVERVLSALEIGKYEVMNMKPFDFVALMFLQFSKESKDPREFLLLCKNNAKSPLVDFDIEIDLRDQIPQVLDDRSRHGWIIIAGNNQKKLIDFTSELNKFVDYELVKEKVLLN